LSLNKFDPQILTLAINQILKDRHTFSRNARLRYLNDHTPESWINSIEKIFKQLGVISR